MFSVGIRDSVYGTVTYRKLKCDGQRLGRDSGANVEVVKLKDGLAQSNEIRRRPEYT